MTLVSQALCCPVDKGGSAELGDAWKPKIVSYCQNQTYQMSGSSCATMTGKSRSTLTSCGARAAAAHEVAEGIRLCQQLPQQLRLHLQRVSPELRGLQRPPSSVHARP